MTGWDWGNGHIRDMVVVLALITAVTVVWVVTAVCEVRAARHKARAAMRKANDVADAAAPSGQTKVVQP